MNSSKKFMVRILTVAVDTIDTNYEIVNTADMGIGIPDGWEVQIPNAIKGLLSKAELSLP